MQKSMKEERRVVPARRSGKVVSNLENAKMPVWKFVSRLAYKLNAWRIKSYFRMTLSYFFIDLSASLTVFFVFSIAPGNSRFRFFFFVSQTTVIASARTSS